MGDGDEQVLMEGPPGAVVRIGGRRYVYFGGTSYLGLHARPEVAEAGCKALRRFGLHTATTRAGFGNSEPVVAMEAAAAGFFAAEAALCLPSGYLTATALLKTIAADHNVLLIDRGSHFAVTDAAKVTGLPRRFFATGDAAALDAALAALGPGDRPLVLTDGLFPMGRIAPLNAYVQSLARFERAAMVVDDAHGFGVLGEHGRGVAEHCRLGDAVNRMDDEAGGVRAEGVSVYVGGTLSKAMGGYGGVIAGERAFIERVRQVSGVFAGASSVPSCVAAASGAAIAIVEREGHTLRQQLQQNVQQVRAGLAAMGLSVEPQSPSPVVAVELESARRMQAVHEGLRQRGLLVPYIARYSGVGEAGALRIAVFATHTSEMIDQLVAELRRILGETSA